MTDLEDRLEDALRRQAEGAGRPRPLTRGDVRRVRWMRAVVGLVGALVVAAGVVTFGVFARPNPVPEPPVVPSLPARVGPYTHRLYVVNGDPSRVAVVKPDADGLELLRTFDLGYQAETALSPDGRRLYSLSFLPDGDRQTMATYDTRTGRLVHDAPIETLLPEGWSTEQFQQTCCTGLYTSPEGGRLYFAERSYTRHHVDDSIWIGTYDAVAGRLLPEAAEIPGCDFGRSVIPMERGTIVVVCTHAQAEAYAETNDARWLTIAADGSTQRSHIVPLTPPASEGSSADVSGELARAVASPDGRWIYAVTRTGLVFVIDARAEDVERVVELDLAGSFEIVGEKVALSPDGQTLYVGTSDTRLVVAGLAHSIQSFDVATWRRTGRVRTASAFTSLSFGPARDDRLYAFMPAGNRQFTGVTGSIGPRSSSIQVFDATSLEQLSRATGVLPLPELGMVPLLDGE